MKTVKFTILLLVLNFFFSFTSLAEDKKDTLSSVYKTPSYIAINGALGTVFPSNSFVSGKYSTPLYQSTGIKYALTAVGDNWKDIAYGLPYYGAAANLVGFGRPTELGVPLSLYLFQGATIAHLGKRLTLNYELNLGLSTGWVPYDPFTNPDNIAIGSTNNVYVAVGAYLKWYLSKRIDLHIGANLTHFSNGTSRQPNYGINMVGIYAEVAYNFHREEFINRYNPEIQVPEFDSHFQHDVQLVITSKNVKIDTLGTNLSDVYNDKQFDVYSLNYYLMRVSNYKYRYGIGVDLQYDASAGAKMYNKLHENGKYYTVTELGPMLDRFSVSVAARGEIVLPYYSIFADVGLTVLNHNNVNPRFFQAVGVKVHLSQTVFATFGIKAVNFSQAQYLYWSIGHTFNSNRKSWLR